MISSLANFLMLVLYHGNYSARVSWTLLMYTMGAVAVARIAIEQNRSHSLMYLGGLGLAAFVVMAGLIERSPIFCAGILALIAYLSDRITHDCTLIDDDVDASGQGLIDFGTAAIKNEINRKTDEETETDPETSTSSDADAIAETDVGSSAKSKSRKRERATHQPGRTVMYLALAALPLFGIGQFLMRSDQQTWSKAQWYLALYLFASLSLLVTTSFLGLRRYLRQRKVDMPGDVTVAWLAGGLVMIAGILGLAYLAPMPGNLLASLEMPAFLTSPSDRQSSKYGWGNEAASKSNPDSKTTQNDKNPDDKEIHSTAPKEGSPPGDSGDGKGEKGPAGKKKGGKKSGSEKSKDGKGPKQDSKSKQQSNGDQGKQQQDKGQQKQSGGSKEEQKQDGKKQDGKKQERKKQGDKQNQQQSKSDPKAGDQKADQSAKKQKPDSKSQNNDKQKPDQEKPENSKPENDYSKSDQSKQNEKSDTKQANKNDSSEKNRNSKKEGAKQQDSQSSQSSPPKSSSGSNLIGKMFSLLGGLIKLLIMVALLIVVVVFVMRYRGALSDWWNRLWNREREVEEELALAQTQTSEPDKPPRPFSSFRNPIGREKDPRKVVVITFQAFEAWMREHGWQRGKDETPNEFLRRVGREIPSAAPDANQIVEAYNRIVFGRGKATKRDMKAAQQIWQAMVA